METIKDFRIDYYGDNFFIVGFQIKYKGIDYTADIWDDMRVKRISQTTTKIFTTPGISLN